MRKKGECVCSGGGAGGRKAPLPFASPGGLPNQLPISPNSFQSPRVPPAENSKMAAIGASEINKEESAEKNVSKIVQG